jgi:hypothetical protein
LLESSVTLLTKAGYALETRCHLGKSIVFDTVGKLGWKVDVRRHVIRDVITRVLEAQDVVWEEGRSAPLAREEVDCEVNINLFHSVSNIDGVAGLYEMGIWGLQIEHLQYCLSCYDNVRTEETTDTSAFHR